MDGGAQNFILKVPAEHLADFNSPAEQKTKKKKLTNKPKNNPISLSETFSRHSASD